MSMRSTFGILALLGLLASSHAALQSYRVTGTFDMGTDDFESLVDTSFTYDFTYDTDAPNVGDEFSAAYEMSAVSLQTALGNAGGIGSAIIDLDPEYGTMAFGGVQPNDDNTFHTYGLVFSDLPPLTPELPTDLVRLSNDHAPSFVLVGANGGVGTLAGVGMASASKVNVQAVPEPASMAVLALGAAGLFRRRRTAA